MKCRPPSRAVPLRRGVSGGRSRRTGSSSESGMKAGTRGEARNFRLSSSEGSCVSIYSKDLKQKKRKFSPTRGQIHLRPCPDAAGRSLPAGLDHREPSPDSGAIHESAARRRAGRAPPTLTRPRTLSAGQVAGTQLLGGDRRRDGCPAGSRLARPRRNPPRAATALDRALGLFVHSKA